MLARRWQCGGLGSSGGHKAASPTVAVLGSRAAAHGNAMSNTKADTACSCPRFNSNQGCVSEELECPLGFAHTCALCGFRNHSLMTCNKRGRAPPPPRIAKQKKPFNLWPGAQQQKGDKGQRRQGWQRRQGQRAQGPRFQAQAQVLTRFLPSVGAAR